MILLFDNNSVTCFVPSFHSLLPPKYTCSRFGRACINISPLLLIWLLLRSSIRNVLFSMIARPSVSMCASCIDIFAIDSLTRGVCSIAFAMWLSAFVRQVGEL